MSSLTILGALLALKGAEGLKALAVPGGVTVIGIVFLTAFILAAVADFVETADTDQIRRINDLRTADADIEQAVAAAVESRLRPVMMSMLTIIFGLSPLVFMPGAGTELYRGVGAIVLFGLLFSTLVTVTFLPVLLTTIPRWRRGPATATG